MTQEELRDAFNAASPTKSERKPLTQTQQSEGFRGEIYNDTEGNETIGYGHKLTLEDKRSGRFANGLSEEDAQRLYDQDHEDHNQTFYKNAPWALEQPQEVREVLEDMAYNMGGGFMDGWENFSKQLQSGDYEGAANNILNSKYARQVKGRANRNAEKLISATKTQDQDYLKTMFEQAGSMDESSEFDGRVSPQGIPLRSSENQQTEDPTLGDSIVGVGETALTMGTAATGGLAGHVYGTLKGFGEEILGGNYGDKDAAKRIEEKAREYAGKLTYTPRSETGQDYAQNTAETLQVLEPLTPLMIQANAVSNAVKTAIPKATKVITPKQHALSEASNRNIPVLTTDINPPKTFVGKNVVQGIGERIPIVGTGKLRATQQSARINAVKDFIANYVDDVTDDTAKDLAKSLNAKRIDKIVKLKQLKTDVFDSLSDRTVPMSKTVGEIDNQVAILKRMNTPVSENAAKMLAGYKDAFKNQNVNTIELVRKELGNLFKDQSLATAKDQGDKAVQAIYGSLKEDLRTFIKKNAGDYDVKKWEVANKQLSALQGELDSGIFKTLLKKGLIEPEKIETFLFSKKPSQVALLYKNLDKQGRNTAKTAIVKRAAEKALGGSTNFDDISVPKFKSELKRLRTPIERFFPKEDKAMYDGLIEALDLTRRADEFKLMPPTGIQNNMVIGGMAATDILGGFWEGIIGGGLAGASIRLYETLPVRRALINLGKTPKGSAEYGKAIQKLLIVIESERSATTED